MYLEVADLRAFTVLASELHFRKASERLFLSQPALSRLVQRLEEQVGGRLFVRTRRKVLLTEAGRVLLPQAERLVRDSGEALSRTRDVVQGRAGTLRVGFGIASVCDILPGAIRRFRRAHPDVGLYLRDMSTMAQVTSIVRGDLDLGVVRLSALPAELDGTPLISERLMLVVPRSFAYNSRRGLAGLEKAPFVILPPSVSPTFHEHVLSLCAGAGFRPNVVQEAGEMFTILNLVRAGIGVSLVPRSASRMKVPGVEYHELRNPDANWEIGPAWSRNTEKLPLIMRFCEHLRAECERRTKRR